MRHHEDKEGKKGSEGLEYGVFFGERLRRNLVKKSPIVEGILYENDVVCISAGTGIGKSILAMQLMCNLTTGHPFLGTYCIPHPFNVLYLQTEGDRAETIERLESMNTVVEMDDSRWAHINLSGICLNTPEGLNQFMGLCNSVPIEIDVVIVDPLYTTVKGSMSSDDVTTDWIRNLREVRKRLYSRCSFLLIGHEGHETVVQGKVIPKRKDRLFGSYCWGNFVNYNYKLSASDGKHILEGGKTRSNKTIDKIELRMIEPVPLMYVHADEDTSSAEYKVLAMLDYEEAKGASEIVKTTNASRATVYRVIKRLLDSSKIEVVEGRFSSLYTKTKSINSVGEIETEAEINIEKSA